MSWATSNSAYGDGRSHLYDASLRGGAAGGVSGARGSSVGAAAAPFPAAAGARGASIGAAAFPSASSYLHRPPFVHPSLLPHERPHAAPAAAVVAAAELYPTLLPEASFRIGQRLDARDAPGKWLPAVVADISSRGNLRSPAGPGEWEADASGAWQPRTGTTLLIHFEGFERKWDEWIHAACFLPPGLTQEALGPALRPRLAPLHSLTTPQGVRRSAPPPHRKGEPVLVRVFQPSPELDDDLLGSPRSNHGGRSRHVPSFEEMWLSAVVLEVEGDQVQVRYDPPQVNSDSFNFPVWFHTKLGEVRRPGERQPAATAAAANAHRATVATAAAPATRDLASAARPSSFAAAAVAGSSSPVRPAKTAPTAAADVGRDLSRLSLTGSTYKPFVSLPVSGAAASSAASAAAAAASSTPVPPSPSRTSARDRFDSSLTTTTASPHTPPSTASAVVPRASSSPRTSSGTASANAATASRHNLFVSPPSATRGVLLHEERASSEDEEEDGGEAPSTGYSVDALLRSSLSAPLRAKVGLINLGNSCYVSAGLQVLAGLQPLIQYFVREKRHERVLAYRRATGHVLPAPPTQTYASMYSSGPVKPLQLQKDDPLALPHTFGQLTMEFASLLQQLHSGRDDRLYCDKLIRLVVNLPSGAGARFKGMHMQDAHEFLAVLLNALHEELNIPPPVEDESKTKQQAAVTTAAAKMDDASPPPFDAAAAARDHWTAFERNNNDVISALFYCQSAQYVICQKCFHASCSHRELGQLTLDIPHIPVAKQPGSSSFLGRMSGGGSSAVPGAMQPVTLDQCLRTYLSADQLDDYTCSNCSKRVPALTSSYLTTLPPLLLVQLKRFAVDPLTGRLVKDETPCAFQETIDLAPLLQPHDSVISAALSTAKDGETPAMPYTLDLSASDTASAGVPSSSMYRLAGVVRHYDAHYTAFAQVRSSEGRAGRNNAAAATDRAWCFFNDSKTYIEQLEDVLAHPEYVYLLVYQRT